MGIIGSLYFSPGPKTYEDIENRNSRHKKSLTRSKSKLFSSFVIPPSISTIFRQNTFEDLNAPFNCFKCFQSFKCQNCLFPAKFCPTLANFMGRDQHPGTRSNLNKVASDLVHSLMKSPHQRLKRIRKFRKWMAAKYSPFESKVNTIARIVFSHAGLLILLLLYSFAGAYLFMYIEGPQEAKTKTSLVKIRDKMLNDLWENATTSILESISTETSLKTIAAIEDSNSEPMTKFIKPLNTNSTKGKRIRRDNIYSESDKNAWMDRARMHMLRYEEVLYKAYKRGRMEANSETRLWTFWGALFYSGTIYTTIGYGHIAPTTNMGRLATILYAVIGIPLMLVALGDFGKLLTRAIKFFWVFIRRYYYTGQCRHVQFTAMTQLGHAYKMMQNTKAVQSMNLAMDKARHTKAMKFMEKGMGELGKSKAGTYMKDHLKRMNSKKDRSNYLTSYEDNKHKINFKDDVKVLTATDTITNTTETDLHLNAQNIRNIKGEYDFVDSPENSEVPPMILKPQIATMHSILTPITIVKPEYVTAIEPIIALPEQMSLASLNRNNNNSNENDVTSNSPKLSNNQTIAPTVQNIENPPIILTRIHARSITDNLSTTDYRRRSTILQPSRTTINFQHTGNVTSDEDISNTHFNTSSDLFISAPFKSISSPTGFQRTSETVINHNTNTSKNVVTLANVFSSPTSIKSDKALQKKINWFNEDAHRFKPAITDRFKINLKMPSGLSPAFKNNILVKKFTVDFKEKATGLNSGNHLPILQGLRGNRESNDVLQNGDNLAKHDIIGKKYNGANLIDDLEVPVVPTQKIERLGKEIIKEQQLQELPNQANYLTATSDKLLVSTCKKLIEPSIVLNDKEKIKQKELLKLSYFAVDDEFNLPVSIAMFLLLSYLFVGGALFAICEPTWDYILAFYFCFISISTIGLGDVVPDNPFNMLIAAIYIFIGLSLTSMCINVFQAYFRSRYNRAAEKIKKKLKWNLEARKAAAIAGGGVTGVSPTDYDRDIKKLSEKLLKAMEGDQNSLPKVLLRAYSIDFEEAVNIFPTETEQISRAIRVIDDNRGSDSSTPTSTTTSESDEDMTEYDDTEAQSKKKTKIKIKKRGKVKVGKAAMIKVRPAQAKICYNDATKPVDRGLFAKAKVVQEVIKRAVPRSSTQRDRNSNMSDYQRSLADTIPHIDDVSSQKSESEDTVVYARANEIIVNDKPFIEGSNTESYKDGTIFSSSRDNLSQDEPITSNEIDDGRKKTSSQFFNKKFIHRESGLFKLTSPFKRKTRNSQEIANNGNTDGISSSRHLESIPMIDDTASSHKLSIDCHNFPLRKLKVLKGNKKNKQILSFTKIDDKPEFSLNDMNQKVGKRFCPSEDTITEDDYLQDTPETDDTLEDINTQRSLRNDTLIGSPKLLDLTFPALANKDSKIRHLDSPSTISSNPSYQSPS
ncbi:unnamed protein product [Gordionus sp. m RMFG-2023]